MESTDQELRTNENGQTSLEQSGAQHSNLSVCQKEDRPTMKEQVMNERCDVEDNVTNLSTLDSGHVDNDNHVESHHTFPHLMIQDQIHSHEIDKTTDNEISIETTEDLRDQAFSEESRVCLNELKKHLAVKPVTTDNSIGFRQNTPSNENLGVKPMENAMKWDENSYDTGEKCIVASTNSEKKIIEDLSFSSEPIQQQENFGNIKSNHDKIDTLPAKAEHVNTACILPEKFEMEFEDSIIVEDRTVCHDSKQFSSSNETPEKDFLKEDQFVCTNGELEKAPLTDYTLEEKLNFTSVGNIHAIDYYHQPHFIDAPEIQPNVNCSQSASKERENDLVEDNTIGTTGNSLTMELSTEDDKLDTNSQQNQDRKGTSQEIKISYIPSIEIPATKNINMTETSLEMELSTEKYDTLDINCHKNDDGEVTDQEMKTGCLPSIETSAAKNIHMPTSETSMKMELSTETCDTIDNLNHKNSLQTCNLDPINQEMQTDQLPSITVDTEYKTLTDTSVGKNVHFASPVYTFHEYNEIVCSSRTETQESLTSHDEREMNVNFVETTERIDCLSNDTNKTNDSMRLHDNTIKDACESKLVPLQEYEDKNLKDPQTYENSDSIHNAIMEEVKDILDKLVVHCVNISEPYKSDKKFLSSDQNEISSKSPHINETSNSPVDNLSVSASLSSSHIMEDCISQNLIDNSNSFEDYSDKAKRLKEENTDKVHQIMSPQLFKDATESSDCEITTSDTLHSEESDDQSEQHNEEFVLFDSEEEGEESEDEITESINENKNMCIETSVTNRKQINEAFLENSNIHIIDNNMKSHDIENQTILPKQNINTLDIHENVKEIASEPATVIDTRENHHSLHPSCESQNTETIQQVVDVSAESVQLNKPSDSILNFNVNENESLKKDNRGAEKQGESCSQFVSTQTRDNLSTGRKDFESIESFQDAISNERSLENVHLLSVENQQNSLSNGNSERKRKNEWTDAENEEPSIKMPYIGTVYPNCANTRTTEIKHMQKEEVTMKRQQNKTHPIKDLLYKNTSDVICEENLHLVEEMDQTVPSSDHSTDLHLQDQNMESQTGDTLYTSETDIDRKNSHQAFKWKYAPSIDLDCIVPGHEEQEDDDKPVIPARLQTCKKPYHLGLSKRQKLPSLHPKLKPN